MIKYLVYLVFIVSVALAVGSIALTSRLRSRYRLEIFSSLLYFLVFIFTFGFYGIWGQVIIKAYLQPFIAIDLIARFSDISILLGLPFLVFAWMMLLRFSGNVSGIKFNSWNLMWFLLINFAIIFGIGILVNSTNTIRPVVLIRYYYMVMSIVHTLAVSYLLKYPLRRNTVIHDYDRKIIRIVLMSVILVQGVLLLFFDKDPLMALGFVVAFFAGNSFLPIYFTYGMILPEVSEEATKVVTIEGFFKKFDISPREADVINEICNGLSNKEISEKLFISIQTVKDHSHRIYIKTNVKSRMHLITLVKEEMSPAASTNTLVGVDRKGD